jgi:hypothetical protein
LPAGGPDRDWSVPPAGKGTTVIASTCLRRQARSDRTAPTARWAMAYIVGLVSR